MTVNHARGNDSTGVAFDHCIGMRDAQLFEVVNSNDAIIFDCDGGVGQNFSLRIHRDDVLAPNKDDGHS